MTVLLVDRIASEMLDHSISHFLDDVYRHIFNLRMLVEGASESSYMWQKASFDPSLSRVSSSLPRRIP